MREHVHGFVFRVLIKVQSCTIIHISIAELEFDDVWKIRGYGCILHYDPVIRKANLVFRHCDAVQFYVGDCLAVKVEEERLIVSGHLSQTETGPEASTKAGLVDCAQVKDQAVRDILEQFGPVLGFLGVQRQILHAKRTVLPNELKVRRYCYLPKVKFLVAYAAVISH